MPDYIVVCRNEGETLVKKLILASKSPRRQEILRTLGVEFSLLVSDVDETVEKLSPKKTVETLAARKCAASTELLDSEERRCSIVISADTVVSFGDEIFGKPHTAENAERMLRKLSGSVHEVHTGIAVMSDGRMTVESETTRVHFRDLTDEEIELYIRSGEPLDKAGAYGIQELGGLFVSAVEGDYFNIVGLPVCRLGRILARDFDYDILREASGKRIDLL